MSWRPDPPMFGGAPRMEAGFATLGRLLELDARRVVVIDDDPTGTQVASEVDLVLNPARFDFKAYFDRSTAALYVLSNSRALSEDAATGWLRTIVSRVQGGAGASTNARQVAFVLRGDSTLRGHVFAEIDVLAEPDSVTLFVPAYPEGGRTTSDGTQWITIDGRRVPAADTEFARDREFGYTSRGLRDWVAEVGGGRPSRIVELDRVRATRGAAIQAALVDAPAGTVVIPEAETRGDVALAAIGLLGAERAGRRVIVRAASTFAAVRAGVRPRTVTRWQAAGDRRVLVVCGSHTDASSAQLRRLSAAAGVEPIALDPTAANGCAQPAVTRQLTASLRQSGIAILTTARTYERTPDRGEQMMRSLVANARAVRHAVDLVIAKGGITSAEIARSSFGADVAHVLGQPAVGVALWRLATPGGRLVPYIAVPGNVGDANLLADLAAIARSGNDR
jgi:uncharacterized protein YgbK (DUF1537 family)